jgi:Transposase, Mutator family
VTTETLVGVSRPKEIKKVVSPAEQELAAARELVKSARARGVALTGPDGLLKAITKTVLESALEEEMSEHVGYDKHAVQGRNGGNSERHPVQDGADRGGRRGERRRAAGSGGHVRAGRSEEAAAPIPRTWSTRKVASSPETPLSC